MEHLCRPSNRWKSRSTKNLLDTVSIYLRTMQTPCIDRRKHLKATPRRRANVRHGLFGRTVRRTNLDTVGLRDPNRRHESLEPSVERRCSALGGASEDVLEAQAGFQEIFPTMLTLIRPPGRKKKPGQPLFGETLEAGVAWRCCLDVCAWTHCKHHAKICI